jgi:N-acetylglucosamine kinase-like BadF-type ATPase
MTRAHIEARIQVLAAELQKADEEAHKLRPRLRYLEEVMVRSDAAIAVLKSLLDDAPPPAAEAPDELRQPVGLP